MNTSRRRTFLAVAGLALYSALAAGSFGAPVPATTAAIIRAAGMVRTLLNAAQLLSAATNKELEGAYSDLGERLRSSNVSVASLGEMEQTRTRLTSQRDSLHATLQGTRAAADQLFGLLESRAKENSTPELRSLMLADIEAKQDEFNARLAEAQAAMARIDTSIQKYDDILGAFQVGIALDLIDEYMRQIDGVIVEADALDRQIQLAIERGKEIVRPYAEMEEGSTAL